MELTACPKDDGDARQRSSHLEHAVMFAKRFLAKLGSNVDGILSCFDRVIFKGYLPFHSEANLNSWVDFILNIRRVDFVKQLEERSDELVEHARQRTAKSGRPYEYRQGWFRKDEVIQDIIRRDGVTEGLVAVLCVQETCRTVKLASGKRRPHLVFANRPQRVLYHYFLDPEFGLMYVRLETWFPYTVQVYVNGHDWLARQMTKHGIGYQQVDNAFVGIADLPEAQRLADRFAQWNWIRQLSKWVASVNPHVAKNGWLHDKEYYWVTEQAEFASDVMFKDAASLGDLYPKLLNHAVVNFSAEDILKFLGRKLCPQFQGEVLTDCKKQRSPGARVKHRMKQNWLKMYDKFGRILRVETVINDPREFKVRRTRTREGQPVKIWCPMNKGVTNLASYQRVCRAANDRYLDALSVVNDPTPAYRQVRELTESKIHQGRRYAGFNPARGKDVRLFKAVASGNHELRGFRNAEIRNRMFRETRDPVERKRQATHVSRLLKRLHVRGLIARIPRTRRWKITVRGRSLIGAVLQLHEHGLPLAA
jgi:hypothetical protein